MLNVREEDGHILLKQTLPRAARINQNKYKYLNFLSQRGTKTSLFRVNTVSVYSAEMLNYVFN